ncbi:DUF6064 family protein [Ramlibacter rhizophilus]|uniref:MFS transporter permease n=1 Tax=Ramlibacter rhizophilus TaxID=1781167 RepID=A0A4Z0BEH8_9BURK|nr:DUF6064 family protein [Ramlibacter rhizophilus]TFY96789.1 hypothetical protein EZ242_19080 [Ramlibacter rhizophilus]
MSEWWTYRPSDFLMFSAGSYARLLERFQRDVWPLQLVLLGLGLVLLLALVRRPAPSARAGAWVLAGVWAWVGWGFYLARFAPINTAAPALAAACFLQAVLMAALAFATPRAGVPRHRAVGVLLAAAGLLAWPLLAPLTGRSLAQAEVFGLSPEPTALFTLGWLLAAPLRHRAWAAVIPLLVLGVGGLMLWLLYGPP